jgi:hypothetical protein
MKRRHFIQAATASVLFTSALKPCVAAVDVILQSRDYVFFDERFPRARRLAASWAAASWGAPSWAAASSRLIAVQGDITPFLRNGFDRMTCDRHPVRLRGVTTESFHFCLKVLLGEHAHLEAQVSRLEPGEPMGHRNLLLWTIHTTAKSEYGTTSWPSLYPRV